MNGAELAGGGTGGLFVPTFDDDVDTLTAALSYAAAGGYVGPAREGSKDPGSILGKQWQSKTSRDPDQIVAWFAGTNYSVFLHAGRSGAVVLDVDHPHKLPDVLVEAITTAGPPFQSTRVTEPGRGHYVFAQPAGRTLGNGTGSKLSKGWGEIRGRNGVIMVAPSRHENAAEGGQYKWLQTGRVPVLPQAVAELLPNSEEAAETATDAELRAFCETYTERRAPSLLVAVLRGYQNDLDKGGARHDSMITATCWAAREARAGCYPALEAFQQLQAAFIKSLEAPRTGSGRTAAPSMARSEFKGIAAWAVAQANTADLAEVHRKIDRVTTEPEWSEPVPLDPPRVPASFPLDALPEFAADFATALAEATQTPPDLVGVCVLGVLSACAGGRAIVEARRGWREPVNIYCLPVLRPGSRKSAVISAATRPVYQVEKSLAITAKTKIIEESTRREIAQQAAAKTLKTAANASTEEQRTKFSREAIAAASLADGMKVPTLPRLIADDVTPEAAASLLADNGGRLALISAEGGIFDVMAGRYSKGVPVLDLWLKGHAGDPLRVDRKGRAPEHVDHPALTLLLTVQPAVLAAIARNGAFRGRGLLARFLYSIPEDNLGYRRVGTAPVTTDVTDNYEKHIRTLAEDLADWTDPAVLVLSADAHELLLDTERLIEPQLAKDGELGPIAEWGSKLAGAILRIAGLLHLANEREAFRTPISRATLKAAVRIGDYFTEHARAAFNLLGDAGTTDAAYLLEHLRKQDTQEFSIRSLHMELPRGRFATVEDVMTAVGSLEDHGYVVALPQPPRVGPGRPPSPKYRVHPDLTKSTQSTEPAVRVGQSSPTTSTPQNPRNPQNPTQSYSVDCVDNVATSEDPQPGLSTTCHGCGEPLLLHLAGRDHCERCRLNGEKRHDRWHVRPRPAHRTARPPPRLCQLVELEYRPLRHNLAARLYGSRGDTNDHRTLATTTRGLPTSCTPSRTGARPVKQARYRLRRPNKRATNATTPAAPHSPRRGPPTLPGRRRSAMAGQPSNPGAVTARSIPARWRRIPALSTTRRCTPTRTEARDPPRSCPHCGKPLQASAAVAHLGCWISRRTRTTPDESDAMTHSDRSVGGMCEVIGASRVVLIPLGPDLPHASCRGQTRPCGTTRSSTSCPATAHAAMCWPSRSAGAAPTSPPATSRDSQTRS